MENKYISYYIMNTTESQLNPSFRRAAMASIKGQRTRHVITMNPNTANPGEEIYIDVPKLKPDSCLVPGTLHMLFDFKNANTKSWFFNNLSKLLVQKLQIRLSGETVYDCNAESIYNVYKDLWKTKTCRSQMVEYGLANSNLRKLISKDDTGATSGDADKVADALLFSIYGTKIRMSLDRIIEDHGLYAPFKMNNNFRYILTLPKATDIMVAQTGEAVEGYSLTNLELEYETIENQNIADQILGMYDIGRSLSYEHLTLLKTQVWDKDTTLINENINVPRKSMKAVVMLFTKRTRAGSEEYIYPNIDSVKVTIEGVPNSIYSQGIPKSRFYDEAKRLFSDKRETDEFMTIKKFFKDGYAFVLDLRSHEDSVTGHGKRVVNTQSGVLLEITKKVTTEDVVCYIFVVSDGLVNFVNRDLQSIQY